MLLVFVLISFPRCVRTVQVNATHAFYGWHRHACGSDEPGSEGMNFSTNCRSPGDNSEQNMETRYRSYPLVLTYDCDDNRQYALVNGQ